MNKILLAVGAVLVVAVLALLVVPALIDWSRYRTDITTRLERATGRDVRIDGDVGLRLLPAPTFTAERVIIGSIEGAKGESAATEPFATADRLDIRLQLMPLLKGDVAVDHLVLDRPVVNLVRLPDGRVNWDFSAADSGQADSQTTAGPADSDDRRMAVSFDELRINRGVVTYRSPESTPVRIDDLDATIRIGSLSGPFAATGSLRFQNNAINFEGALDRMAEDRGSPARLAVSVPQAEATLTVNGMVSNLSTGPTLRGRVTVDAPRPVRLAALLGAGPPPLPPGPLRIEASLTASADHAALSDIEARLGDSRASGTVGIGFGDMAKVDAALSIATLNMDAWTASPATAPAARSQPAAPQQRAPQQRAPQAPAPTPPAADFTLPRDLFVNATLGIEALSWQGAVVEEVRIDATLDQGELVLGNASARLPGNSAVTIAGTLTAEQGRPVFDGQAALRSDNARALLAWAGVDVSSVPPDRLHRLDAQTALRAAWPTIEARTLILAVDSTRAKGSATARMTERPFYGLTLAADAVNLDAYLPAADTPQAQPAPTQRPASPPATPPAPAPAAPTDPLAGFDADIRLGVDRLVVNTVPAEAVRLDAALAAGTLTIREASADLAGSRARIGGSVLDLGQANPRVENLTFTVDSPRPERLFRFLGIEPPVEPARLGQLSAQGRLDGDFQAIRLDATLRTGGIEARAQGNLSSPLSGVRYQLAVQAGHPSLTQFIRLFSPSYRPAGTVGALQVNANVAGGPAQMQVSNLDIHAGPARLTGAATIGFGGVRPLIDADLAGNAIILDPFLPADGRTGLMLPVPGGLRSPPGALPGTAQPVVPAATAAPGPWSSEPLNLAGLNAADAKIGLVATSLTWGEWVLEQPQARLVVDAGTAHLQQFTGRLLGGTLDATAMLASASTPSLNGTLKIDGANLARAKLGAGGIAVTQGRLNAEARFQTQGRSTRAMAGALQGQGRLLSNDGAVSGFDLAAVNKQLANIDNVGNLLALVQTGLSGGQTRFSQLAGTFTAENGVVVTRDTRLTAEGGGATMNAEIRLVPWTMNSVVSLQLADTTAPPVHVRLEGPIDNPRRIFDINALQQHLVARGLGRALKGDPGRIIEDLLGGGRRAPPASPAQPSPEQPPAQPEKPEKVIRDLLRGLVR